MNILWVTFAPLPLNTGGAIGIYKRIEQLAKNNHIFLCYIGDVVKKTHIDELDELCFEVYGFERKRKSNLVTICKYLRSPLTAATRYNKDMVTLIKKIIIEKHIDLINVDFPQTCINLLPLLTIIDVPVVLNEHNNEWMRFKDLSTSSYGLKKVFYFLEYKKLYRFEKKIENSGLVSYYTFVSNKNKDNFRKVFGIDEERTFHVPVGADSYNIQSNHAGNGTKIMFFGAMDSEFNEEAVLWFVKYVYPQILLKNKNVKFYIVGRNPSERVKALQSLNVVVTGTVESLNDFYSDADIVVVPLLRGGGVKVKLLEAVGHNKIIVSTSVGVEGTTFQPNEHLYVADDAKDFANKCLAALVDNPEVEDMRSRMYKHFIENYTWENIGKKYQAILNQCCMSEIKEES